jgi:dihydroorotate dehydrogenase (fumarate)
MSHRMITVDGNEAAASVLRQAITLSTSSELPLRLRWVGMLAGRVGISLAASGGVHTPMDVIKSIMAGAHGVPVVSALLRNGPSYLKVLREKAVEWLEEHGYSSLHELHGSLSLLHACPDPQAYERANSMLVLQSPNAPETAR